MSLKAEDALAVAQSYTNKKFIESITEKFAEANIDDDGNLIITTADNSISFEKNELGELVLKVENTISDVDETELNTAIDSVVNEVFGGETE